MLEAGWLVFCGRERLGVGLDGCVVLMKTPVCWCGVDESFHVVFRVV